MKINVMISHDKTLTLDVDPNESIENVKALLEVQANIVLPQQQLFYNNSEIKNSDTLSGLGVKNGDLLTLVSKNSSVLAGRDLSLNPDAVIQKDLEFAQALSGHDLDKIQDIEAEKKIEAAIQQKRINEKWAAAVEYYPQGISQDVLPFVDIEVNGVPVKALVDSGAGSSAISWSFATRCGLLLDHKYRTVAVGVGQAEIVARIHCAPIKIGSNYYPCPFIVFLISNMEVIIGLDMLRKHKDNTLKLEGGKFSVPFLLEKYMPYGFPREMRT